MATEKTIAAFFQEEGRKKHQFRPHKLFANTAWVQRFLNRESQPPITLELDPTLSCNDKCPFCVHGWALQGRELSVSQIDRILGEAEALGIPGLTITGGGDPLMHTRIFDVLDCIRGRKFESGLYTNGGPLQRPGLAEAVVSAFTWIRISIDSGSEENFRIIRGHGGYQKRMQCLEKLAEARRKTGSRAMIGASFLTSERVANDIVQATRDVKNAGLDYIQFKPMIKWNLATHHHRSPSMNQKGVFQAIHDASQLASDTFRVIGSPTKYEAEALGEPRVYSQYHAGWVVAAVAPNLKGEIMPTLYLECSVKYQERWAMGEFSSLSGILASRERERMIRETSSDVYCVFPEKGATYSHMLDAVLRRHEQRPLSAEEIGVLAPEVVEHPFSL
jgi:MoaA/NifB/PqqE/SkfB family radical SAM enzyme